MNAWQALYPGDSVALVAVNVAVQVAGVVLLAGLISRGLARRSPAAAHGVWRCALACVCLSPLAAWAFQQSGLCVARLPLLEMPAEAPNSHAQHADRNGQRAASIAAGDARGNGARHELSGASDRQGRGAGRGAAAASVSKRAAWLSLNSPAALEWFRRAVTVLAAVWAAGCLILLARLARGWWLLRTLRRELLPLCPKRVGDVASRVCRRLGIDALPPLATSDRVAGPISFGVFRPVIVLPRRAVEVLDQRQLHDVLVHETAHVLHRDHAEGAVQRLVQAVFWPHPLVHWLGRELSRTREDICDNHVLCGSDAFSYARTLLALARAAGPGRRAVLAAGMSALHGRLERRVARLFDTRRNLLTRARSSLLAAAGLILLGLVAGLAGTRLETVATEPNTAPKPPHNPPAAVVLADSRAALPPAAAGEASTPRAAQTAAPQPAGRHPSIDGSAVRPEKRRQPGEGRPQGRLDLLPSGTETSPAAAASLPSEPDQTVKDGGQSASDSTSAAARPEPAHQRAAAPEPAERADRTVSSLAAPAGWRPEDRPLAQSEPVRLGDLELVTVARGRWRVSEAERPFPIPVGLQLTNLGPASVEFHPASAIPLVRAADGELMVVGALEGHGQSSWTVQIGPGQTRLLLMEDSRLELRDDAGQLLWLGAAWDGELFEQLLVLADEYAVSFGLPQEDGSLLTTGEVRCRLARPEPEAAGSQGPNPATGLFSAPELQRFEEILLRTGATLRSRLGWLEQQATGQRPIPPAGERPEKTEQKGPPGRAPERGTKDGAPR